MASLFIVVAGRAHSLVERLVYWLTSEKPAADTLSIKTATLHSHDDFFLKWQHVDTCRLYSADRDQRDPRLSDRLVCVTADYRAR